MKDIVLCLKSPAKINCFLRITGRLSDGYHTIVTLFRKVSLYDRIRLLIYPNSITQQDITISVKGDSNVPQDERNLAFKAASMFMKEAGIRFKLYITLFKRIPSGAGLGGGSSNASSVLTGLNSVFGHPLSQDAILRLSRELGADCPFFCSPYNAALGLSIGDDLRKVFLKDYIYILLMPDIHIDTKWAYSRYDDLRNLGDFTSGCHCILTNGKDEISFVADVIDEVRGWVNDLELSVIERYPEIRDCKKALIDSGAIISLMTGSGSAVFGVFENADAAQKGIEILKKTMGGNLPRYEMVKGL